MKYSVTNMLTEEKFTVEHWCIHEIRDGIHRGIKERGWNEKDIVILREDD